MKKASSIAAQKQPASSRKSAELQTALSSSALSNRHKIIILLSSIVINLVFLFGGASDPTFSVPLIDEETYHVAATQITSGAYHPVGPYWQPPLLQYFLAATYSIFGPDPVTGRVAVAVLCGLTALLASLIACRLFGKREAFAAAIVSMLCGPLLFYNTRLLPAGLAAMLCTAFLYQIITIRKSAAPWRWGAAGLTLGLAALTVANAMLCWLLVPLYLWWKKSLKSQWKVLVFFTLGMVCAIAPVTLRNYVVSKQVVLISSNGGVNFFIGNAGNMDEALQARPGFGWEYLAGTAVRHGMKSATQQDRYFMGESVKFIAHHPIEFARNLGRKVLLFVASYEIARNYDIYAFREYYWLLKPLTWHIGTVGFPFALLFPLAGFGAIAALWRKQRADAAIIVGFALLYGATVVLYFAASRYRIVILPPLIILAAHGAVVLWTMRSTKNRAMGIAIIAALITLCCLPIHIANKKFSFKAEMMVLLGLIEEEKGHYQLALDRYAQAIGIDSTCARAYNSIACLQIAQNNIASAQSLLQRSIVMDPHFSIGMKNLGLLQATAGDFDQGISLLQQAIELSPECADYYFTLGKIYYMKSAFGEALNCFAKAGSVDATEYKSYAYACWIMATCPSDQIRNSAKALTMFKTHLWDKQNMREPWIMLTLAAIYADVHSCQYVEMAAKSAMDLAKKPGAQVNAQRMNEILAKLRKCEPIRDSLLVGPE